MQHLAVRAFDDAESGLRERNAFHALTDPDEWTAFNAKAMLGIALLELGKGPEALQPLEAGFVGIKGRAADIPAAVRRERLEVEPGAAPDTAMSLGRHRSLGGGGAGKFVR